MFETTSDEATFLYFYITELLFYGKTASICYLDEALKFKTSASVLAGAFLTSKNSVCWSPVSARFSSSR